MAILYFIIGVICYVSIVVTPDVFPNEVVSGSPLVPIVVAVHIQFGFAIGQVQVKCPVNVPTFIIPSSFNALGLFFSICANVLVATAVIIINAANTIDR